MQEMLQTPDFVYFPQHVLVSTIGGNGAENMEKKAILSKFVLEISDACYAKGKKEWTSGGS